MDKKHESIFLYYYQMYLRTLLLYEETYPLNLMLNA